MRMLCIGGKEGVWRGAVGAVYEEEKRKGVVRQALQTLCSEGTSEKPEHISRSKKPKNKKKTRVLQQPQ